MLVAIVLSYLLGILTGAAGLAVYVLYRVRQLTKQIAAPAAPAPEGSKPQENSVAERLNKVRDILKKQLAMYAYLDQPSKNALHSKHKNQLNYELRQLEDEKLEILRSILKDGHDPVITAVNPDNNEAESIKLSEWMERNGHADPLAPAAATDGKGPRKVGKFFVYNGGNNDDTTH